MKYAKGDDLMKMLVILFSISNRIKSALMMMIGLIVFSYFLNCYSTFMVLYL